MGRSSRSRTARRSGSRRTASGAERTPVPLIAVPDGDGRLSEGLLVDGRLVARLLGVRLLTIDTRLVLAPAQLEAPPLRDSRRPLSPAVGARLAAAERLINGEETGARPG
jgi:hypothetical protein